MNTAPKLERLCFDELERSPHQHFVLHFYAAIHALVKLLRTRCADEEKFSALLNQHVAVADYWSEVTAYLPEELSWGDSSNWWRQQIQAWEGAGDQVLPLARLASTLGISWEERLAVILCGLSEEDSRFGGLFAELQPPLSQRRPCVELLAAILSRRDYRCDPWQLCDNLIGNDLVIALNSDDARSEWVLRVPSLVWSAVRGSEKLPLDARGSVHPPGSFPSTGELILDEKNHDRFLRLPELLVTKGLRFLVLRADPGTDLIEYFGAVAGELGLGVLEMDYTDMNPAGSLTGLGPMATARGLFPVLRYDLPPGERLAPPELRGYRGAIGLALGFEGGLIDRASEKSLTLRLPFPSADQRKQHWKNVFRDVSFPDLDSVSQRLHISGRFIRQVASGASASASLDGRVSVSSDDVKNACGSLNRHLLDKLADHLPADGSWSDLAIGSRTSEQINLLERRCRHRERVLAHLGRGFRNASNRGVRVLFTGPSGTGKTLAAKILSSALGMDIYRVDLAAVVNKYIGETEKNLHQVLSRAEALDVILLLDEGDALLGGRTEVKSATDRYANLETNYLLQRLEHYQGIVVITTNLGDNIDTAFQRRMDVVVPFFLPGVDERRQILALHLPDNHAISPNLVDLAASHCELNGGQLRNVAMQAALLALDEESRMQTHHLDAALRCEYRKAGGVFPLDAYLDDGNTNDAGMDSFISALAEY